MTLTSFFIRFRQEYEVPLKPEEFREMVETLKRKYVYRAVGRKGHFTYIVVMNSTEVAVLYADSKLNSIEFRMPYETSNYRKALEETEKEVREARELLEKEEYVADVRVYPYTIGGYIRDFVISVRVPRYTVSCMYAAVLDPVTKTCDLSLLADLMRYIPLAFNLLRPM